MYLFADNQAGDVQDNQHLSYQNCEKYTKAEEMNFHKTEYLATTEELAEDLKIQNGKEIEEKNT